MEEKLSLDDLLERVKKNKSKETDFKGDSVREFISDFNLVNGVDKIPTYVLYYTYMERFKTDNFKVSKIQFFRLIAKEFKQVRHGRQRFYLLNKEVIRVKVDEVKKVAKDYGIKKEEW